MSKESCTVLGPPKYYLYGVYTDTYHYRPRFYMQNVHKFTVKQVQSILYNWELAN